MTPPDQSSKPRLRATSPSEISGKHIVFFDGECSFCNRSTQLLTSLDNKQRLYFSSLQGETAKELNLTQDLSSEQAAAVLVEYTNSQKQKIWYGADAILRALHLVGGIASLAWLLHYCPAAIKNTCYQWIAKRRHKISQHCSMPTPEERQRHLP